MATMTGKRPLSFSNRLSRMPTRCTCPRARQFEGSCAKERPIWPDSPAIRVSVRYNFVPMRPLAPIAHPSSSSPPQAPPAPEAVAAEVDVSVLVPVKDEEESVRELATRVTAVLDRAGPGPARVATAHRRGAAR